METIEKEKKEEKTMFILHYTSQRSLFTKQLNKIETMLNNSAYNFDNHQTTFTIQLALS